MSNHIHLKDNSLFLYFLLDHPRFKSLYYSWKDAIEQGLDNEPDLYERLYKAMYEVGFFGESQ